MADDLARLPAAIRLARRAKTNTVQNITLSLASIAILVIAALAGGLSLTAGVLLNEGSALLIIAKRTPTPQATRRRRIIMNDEAPQIRGRQLMSRPQTKASQETGEP